MIKSNLLMFLLLAMCGQRVLGVPTASGSVTILERGIDFEKPIPQDLRNLQKGSLEDRALAADVLPLEILEVEKGGFHHGGFFDDNRFWTMRESGEFHIWHFNGESLSLVKEAFFGDALVAAFLNAEKTHLIKVSGDEILTIINLADSLVENEIELPAGMWDAIDIRYFYKKIIFLAAELSFDDDTKKKGWLLWDLQANANHLMMFKEIEKADELAFLPAASAVIMACDGELTWISLNDKKGHVFGEYPEPLTALFCFGDEKFLVAVGRSTVQFFSREHHDMSFTLLGTIVSDDEDNQPIVGFALTNGGQHCIIRHAETEYSEIFDVKTKKRIATIKLVTYSFDGAPNQEYFLGCNENEDLVVKHRKKDDADIFDITKDYDGVELWAAGTYFTPVQQCLLRELQMLPASNRLNLSREWIEVFEGLPVLIKEKYRGNIQSLLQKVSEPVESSSLSTGTLVAAAVLCGLVILGSYGLSC